jgi:hypothetical protein
LNVFQHVFGSINGDIWAVKNNARIKRRFLAYFYLNEALKKKKERKKALKYV